MKTETSKKAGLQGFLISLDDWWFGRRSPVALGLFRVLIASMAFISLALTLFDFDAWYTERGFAPVRLIERWMHYPSSRVHFGEELFFTLPFEIPRLNLLSGVTNSGVTLAFYLAVMLLALLTAVGLWTRVSSILLAIGIVSLHHRNPLILHSGDSLLRLCMLYIAVAPSGAAVSLDRFIGVWRGRLPKEPEPVSLWGQRLIQYQVALLYFTTAWWKWFGTYWKDGTATWYPTQLREFDRFWIPPILEQQPFIAITTYGTLVAEVALATLVFYKPLRKWVLLSGIALHGYIEWRFNIPMFAFIILSTYVCFYDGEEVQAWAKRLGARFKRLKLKMLLPEGQRLHPTRGAAIDNLDALGVVEFDYGQAGMWQAIDAAGKLKRNPARAAWLRMPGAWPFLMPGLWRRMLESSTEPVEPPAKSDRERREAGVAK
jgi:hypothetical protein